MVLGQMQAVEAGLVGGLDEIESLVEQGGERALTVLDVVEQSDFHDAQGPFECRRIVPGLSRE